MWNLNFLVTTPLLVLGNPKASPSGEVVLNMDHVLGKARWALLHEQGPTWGQAAREARQAAREALVRGKAWVSKASKPSYQPSSSIRTNLLEDVDEEDVDEEDVDEEDGSAVMNQDDVVTSALRKKGGAVLRRKGHKRVVHRLRVSYRGQVFRTWNGVDEGKGKLGKLVMPYPVGLHSDEVKVEWATQEGRFRGLKGLVYPELAKHWDHTLELAKHDDDDDDAAKGEAARCARHTRHFYDSSHHGHGTERHHFMHRGNVDVDVGEEGEDAKINVGEKGKKPINVVFMFPGLNTEHMIRGEHGTSKVADAGFNTWYRDMCKQLAGIQQEFLIVVVAPMYQGHPIMRDLYLEMGIMYTHQYTRQAWVHPVLQELAHAGYKPKIIFAGNSVGGIIATWHAITYGETQVSSGDVDVVVDPFRAYDTECASAAVDAAASQRRPLEKFSTSLHQCLRERDSAEDAGVKAKEYPAYASLHGGLYSLRLLLTTKDIDKVRNEARHGMMDYYMPKILEREKTERTEKRVTLTRAKLLQRELPDGDNLPSLRDILRAHDALKSFTWRNLDYKMNAVLIHIFKRD